MEEIVKRILDSDIVRNIDGKLHLVILYYKEFNRCFLKINDSIVDYEINKQELICIYDFVNSNNSNSNNSNYNRITLDLNYDGSYVIAHDFDRDFADEHMRL